MNQHAPAEEALPDIRRRLYRLMDTIAGILRSYHEMTSSYARKISHHERKIKQLKERQGKRCSTLTKRLSALGETAYRSAQQHREDLTRERKIVRSDAGNAITWRASQAVEILDEKALIAELREKNLFERFAEEEITIKKRAMLDNPELVETLQYARIVERSKFVVLAGGLRQRLEARLYGEEREWEVVESASRKKT